MTDLNPEQVREWVENAERSEWATVEHQARLIQVGNSWLAQGEELAAAREALEKIAAGHCVRNIDGNCIGPTHCAKHSAEAALAAPSKS